MSDELREYVAQHTGTSRRTFLTKLLAGAVFTVPVVASFTMGGNSAIGVPAGSGSNTGGSNVTPGAPNPACAQVPADVPASDVVCDPDGPGRGKGPKPRP